VAERMQEEDEYNGFPFSKENEHSPLHTHTHTHTHTHIYIYIYSFIYNAHITT